MNRWYAIHCKTGKESVVKQQYSICNIDVYFPCIVSLEKNHYSSKPKPYFPGYLFIHLNSEQVNWSKIKWIPFIYGVVCYGDEPIPIPEEFISSLKKQLGQASPILPKQNIDIRQGDRIQVTRGVFEGYEAVFSQCKSGTERACVLLHMIENRFIHVELPFEHIQPI